MSDRDESIHDDGIEKLRQTATAEVEVALHMALENDDVRRWLLQLLSLIHLVLLEQGHENPKDQAIIADYLKAGMRSPVFPFSIEPDDNREPDVVSRIFRRSNVVFSVMNGFMNLIWKHAGKKSDRN